MTDTSLTIAGRVLDDAGKPVAHARIGIIDSPVAMPDVALLTDFDGRFVLGVPMAGRYGLSIAADACGSTRITVQVPDDAQALTVRLPR